MDLNTTNNFDDLALLPSDHQMEVQELISRRQLHDELLIRLRDFIIEGNLCSGEKIPEKELCERFGVSRTPLREALKVLAYEKLVVLNHNRGAIVKPLTLQDALEAFPIYGRLEALAGELACQHLTRPELDQLRRLQDRMFARFKSRDLKGLTAANEMIHAHIQAGSRNRTLVHLMRGVSSRVRRARLSIVIPEARLTKALTEHELIMAAFEKRDASALSRAIRDHIEGTFRFFREALSAKQNSSISLIGKNRLGTPEAA